MQCERTVYWSTAKGLPDVAKKAGYTRLNGALPPFVGQIVWVAPQLLFLLFLFHVVEHGKGLVLAVFHDLALARSLVVDTT